MYNMVKVMYRNYKKIEISYLEHYRGVGIGINLMLACLGKAIVHILK